MSWPAGDERDARAAFPACGFALAQWIRRASVVAINEPGAVVRHEEDQGVIVQAVLLKGREDLPGRPINLFARISVKAAFGFPTEFVADGQRHVRHGVGEVEEEGALAVGA